VISELSASLVTERVSCVTYRERFLRILLRFRRYSDRPFLMLQIDEHEALNDDPLSDEVLDERELLKDSGEDKNMAAEPGTSGANVSLSAADFKSLSLAILNVSKRLDNFYDG